MTDKTVSDLTAATTPFTGTEQIYIVQGGADRKITLADILNYVGVVVDDGGDGTVKSINGETPDPAGEVSLNALNVSVTSTATTLTPAGSTIEDWLVAIDSDLADVPSTPTQQVFTSSGTWTKPTGCTSVAVMVVGGGGGGGTPTAVSSQVGLGGSGGGGGTSFKTIDVTAISTAAVTVGAGGTGGSTAGSAGTAGGTSSFGTHCSATGGGAGGVLAAGTTAGRVLGGAGGTGSGGDINITGASAGLSFRSDGSSGGGYSSAGGSSYFGGGGRGAGSGSDGFAGGNYGGGGSGGVSNSTTVCFGGPGAGGIAVVTEYY